MVCSKCGVCCSFMPFRVEDRVYVQEELDCYEMRGIKFERRFVKHQSELYLIVPCKCKFLDSNNICSIWDTRPSVCRKDCRKVKAFKFKECTDED